MRPVLASLDNSPVLASLDKQNIFHSIKIIFRWSIWVSLSLSRWPATPESPAKVGGGWGGGFHCSTSSGGSFRCRASQCGGAHSWTPSLPSHSHRACSGTHVLSSHGHGGRSRTHGLSCHGHWGPCSAFSAMAPCSVGSATAPFSRPAYAPQSRFYSPSWAWPSPGLCLFHLHSTTLLDFLGSVFVLLGRQELPLEGGYVRSIFGSVPCSCFHVFYFEV